MSQAHPCLPAPDHRSRAAERGPQARLNATLKQEWACAAAYVSCQARLDDLESSQHHYKHRHHVAHDG